MNKTANQEIRIYKSDGSDGYLTGTYGCVALLAFGALGYNARVSTVVVDRSGAIYACSAPADRVHSR
jgi:hypothetical protein